MSGQQVAFNEASAAGDVDPGHLHDFVGAVAGLVRQRPTLSLVNVAGVVTARDNRLFAEMQSALRHDQLALLLEAMGRCPSGYDGSEPTWPAGKVVGFECVGATLAKDLGVGLVSLPSAEQWRSERLAYEPAEQVAVGAGEALVNCYDEPSGVTYYRRWGHWCRDTVTEVGEVWERRADLYPRLSFLDEVRRHLEGLEPEHLRQVLTRLGEIDDSVEEWAQRPEDSRSPFPSWKTKVTPESTTRKSLCYFPEDGVRTLFELHARYTPGAGRIHFRMDHELSRVVVAYVGTKLGE